MNAFPGAVGAGGAIPGGFPVTGAGAGTNFGPGMMFPRMTGMPPQGMGPGGGANVFGGMPQGMGTHGATGMPVMAPNGGASGMTAMFPGTAGMAGATTGGTNMFPSAFGTTGANGMGSSQFAFMDPNVWAGSTAGSNLVSPNTNTGSDPVMSGSGRPMGMANMFSG